MRHRALIGLLSVLVLTPVEAQRIPMLNLWTGKILLDRLNGEPLGQIIARAYVSGVVDSINSFHSIGGKRTQICAPKGTTDYQYAEVAKQYLLNHPESQNASAANLVHHAMLVAFSCGK